MLGLSAIIRIMFWIPNRMMRKREAFLRSQELRGEKEGKKEKERGRKEEGKGKESGKRKKKEQEKDNVR